MNILFNKQFKGVSRSVWTINISSIHGLYLDYDEQSYISAFLILLIIYAQIPHPADKLQIIEQNLLSKTDFSSVG